MATNYSSEAKNLKPGQQTKPQTFGGVSTWFERSCDGATIRLIRETKSGKTETSNIVKTWNF